MSVTRITLLCLVAAGPVAGCVGAVDSTSKSSDPDAPSGDGIASCNECQEGATQCSGVAVETCGKDSDGCWRWSAPTACTGYDTCQVGACIPTCTPTWLVNNTNWTNNNQIYASSILGLPGAGVCEYLQYNTCLATNLLLNIPPADATGNGFWGAAAAANEWVIFNFGSPVMLSGFRASILALAPHSYNPAATAKDVVFQTAPTIGGPWTDATGFQLAQNTGFQAVNFMPVSSQYWRMLVKNNWGYATGTVVDRVGFFGCM